MTTKQEVKHNIMRRIMELRIKDLIEEDCILDVLDDNLEPYVAELEKKIKSLEGQSSLHEGILWNDLHKLEDEVALKDEEIGCIETDYNTYKSEAIKIIQDLLECLKQDTNDPQTNYYVCQYMDKAEKFIKE